MSKPDFLSSDWRAHFNSPPKIHIVEESQCDTRALSDAAKSVGLTVFTLDAGRIASRCDLMDGLAASVGFPSYFGRNWDAVSDLLRDLSWAPATGYVLMITGADNLLAIGTNDFQTFVQVLDTAVHHWWDERGEYSERSAPVSFHVVLCGTDKLRGTLPSLSDTIICVHHHQASATADEIKH
jgi:RNAse (barnase) inhibitor barstar